MPNAVRMMGYRLTMTMGIRNTTSSAAYLPRTTLVMVRGREYSSWSVFWRRSSAKTRMVRMGTMTRNTKDIPPRTYSKLVTAIFRLYTMV